MTINRKKGDTCWIVKTTYKLDENGTPQFYICLEYGSVVNVFYNGYCYVITLSSGGQRLNVYEDATGIFYHSDYKTRKECKFVALKYKNEVENKTNRYYWNLG